MNAQRFLVFAVLTAALTVTLPAPASAQVATTDNAPSAASALVFPPDSNIFGRSYAEWAEQWYLWWDLIPVSTNPSFDTTGQDCNIHQNLPVFFLAGDGNFSGSLVTRTCTVPRNVPLFFPMITVECSNVEAPPFFGRTDADRLECARGFVDGVAPISVVVTVDGQSVPALRNFRVASPPFFFLTPPKDNVFFLDGVTSGRSETDGYWAMLKPLSPGKHTVHFEAAISAGPGRTEGPPFNGLQQIVTYNLTVK